MLAMYKKQAKEQGLPLETVMERAGISQLQIESLMEQPSKAQRPDELGGGPVSGEPSSFGAASSAGSTGRAPRSGDQLELAQAQAVLEASAMDVASGELGSPNVPMAPPSPSLKPEKTIG